MKRKVLKWLGLALLLLAAVFGVIASGVMPIPASSRHWAFTHWLLDFAKRRSVATHTLGGEPLKLDADWLVLKGAGHYYTGCQPCHGDTRENAFAFIEHGATPHPPYLPPKVGRWEPDELFYIVKHGIKFTGMPAWPSQRRDDEVEAMVAFLLKLPSLEDADLRALFFPAPGTPGSGPAAPAGGAPAPAVVAERCLRCHGADGGGRGLGAFPKLAGQRRDYLLGSLEAYARGARHSGIMQPVAVGLTAEQRRQLADYYAALPPGGPAAAQAEAVERARRIAHDGVPSQGVPMCILCHGPREGPINPSYPSLAGQYGDYLALQLQLFKRRERGGTPYAELMHYVATRLTDAQMQDVSAYFASLPPHAR